MIFQIGFIMKIQREREKENNEILFPGADYKNMADYISDFAEYMSENYPFEEYTITIRRVLERKEAENADSD